MKLDKVCYTADFETITRNGVCNVWLWDVCHIVNKKHTTGRTLSEFFDYINNLSYTSEIYFHNLKFDGSFIVDFFLKNGFEYKNSKTQFLRKNQFNLVVTESGQFFSMSYRNSNNVFIHIYDSLKLLPSSVKALAKDFNLEIQKGEIDYNKWRSYDYIPNKKEVSYVRTDSEIVANCLHNFMCEGNTKKTISSCAFDQYKRIIGKDKYNAWFGEWSKNANLELDKEIREAYRGGFCQYNVDYVGKTIKKPSYYNDVNSLYPYIMYTKSLPYGQPVKFEGKYEEDAEYPYYVQKILVDMCIRENGIPCILRAHKRVNNMYIIDTSDEIGVCALELTLTNFDLELLYKNYEIFHIEYLGGYKFKVRNDMFTKYIDKYYKMKQEATTNHQRAKRYIAKLFLNSLYGKFGQNPIRRMKQPYVSIDNSIKYAICDEEVAKNFHYLPAAVFITALARYKILNDIEKIGKDNWIYTDTDSIISLCKLPDDMLDNEELGKYKIEHMFRKFKTLGQKTYHGTTLNKQIVCKACGCNKGALENYPLGKFEYNQKVANGRVNLVTKEGGKELDFSEFTFKNNTRIYKVYKENGQTICEIKDYKFIRKYAHSVNKLLTK